MCVPTPPQHSGISVLLLPFISMSVPTPSSRTMSPKPESSPMVSPAHSKPPLAPKTPRAPTPQPQQQQEDRNGDGASSHASETPSDLDVAVPLARKSSDLSDLSGSIHGGSSVHSNGVPRHISTDGGVASSRQPWKQPWILSTQPPKDNGVIIVERQGSGVEVVKTEKPSLQSSADNRTPLVVLLMDPPRKWYELLLLWIDVSTDTVRDVFQSAKSKIHGRWRQDYDGFLQLRGGKWNHLINCLAVKKYDVAPYEVWIAIPSSMAGTVTVSCADHLLKHLRNIGTVSQGIGGLLSKPGDNSPPRRKNKGATAPSVDGVLTLSLVARSRIYAPEGILKHHHASMFLTFSPPFEPEVAPQQQESDCDDSSYSFATMSGLSFEMAGMESGKSSTHSGQRGFQRASSFSPLDNEKSVASAGSGAVQEYGNRLFFNPKPLKTVRRKGEESSKTVNSRPYSSRQRRDGMVRFKLLGGCFGRVDCTADREAGYDWNMPGSSSDFYGQMRALDTATARTESPTLGRPITDSWIESEDDYSYISHQDSFAPLINRRDADTTSFSIRKNKVTDCGGVHI